MGFFGRLRNALPSWLGGSSRSSERDSPAPPSPSEPADSPDWGRAFGSGDEAFSMSNAGHDFSWYIAGYKAIHGEREDLEKEPDRVLTDRELRNADYVVVKFSGAAGYRTFTSGPWDDWEDLWTDLGDFYDVYGE